MSKEKEIKHTKEFSQKGINKKTRSKNMKSIKSMIELSSKFIKMDLVTGIELAVFEI